MSGGRRLQERVIPFVRAYGLHQPDRTPCGQPVSISEAHALLELDRDAPLTQKELGARLRLEKSTVTRLVSQLEERRWLRRERHLVDGRMVRLWLTDPGQQAATQLATARAAMFARLMGAIPAAEQAGVLHALDVLVEALQSQPTVKEEE